MERLTLSLVSHVSKSYICIFTLTRLSLVFNLPIKMTVPLKTELL
jgi:hypothetical protein